MRLATFMIVALAGCSLARHQASLREPDTRYQLMVGGSQTDIQRANVLARKCQVQGTRVGTFKGHPVLYVERRAMQSMTFLSPPWECFTQGLLSKEFSDQLAFFGSEAATHEK